MNHPDPGPVWALFERTKDEAEKGAQGRLEGLYASPFIAAEDARRLGGAPRYHVQKWKVDIEPVAAFEPVDPDVTVEVK